MKHLLPKIIIGIAAAAAAGQVHADEHEKPYRSAEPAKSYRLTTADRGYTYTQVHHRNRHYRHGSRYRGSRSHHGSRRHYRTPRHERDRHYDDNRRHYREGRDRRYDDDRRHYREERRYRRAVRRAWFRRHSHYHYGDYCPFARTAYPYYDSRLSGWVVVPYRRH